MRHQVALRLLAVLVTVSFACAASPPPIASPAGAGSAATAPPVTLCEHRVPAEECTKHHPELGASFKKMNDWCGEHGVPESHCHDCHPGLTFEALPAIPPGADVENVSNMGEDVPSLAAHAAAGKITIFDFHATWCAPCKKVDRHLRELLGSRQDLAIRRLNVMSWETPLAKRYLAEVPSLPHVIVYGRDSKEVKAISGLDLPALDRAIAEAARR